MLWSPVPFSMAVTDPLLEPSKTAVPKRLAPSVKLTRPVGSFPGPPSPVTSALRVTGLPDGIDVGVAVNLTRVALAIMGVRV